MPFSVNQASHLATTISRDTSDAPPSCTLYGRYAAKSRIARTRSASIARNALSVLRLVRDAVARFEPAATLTLAFAFFFDIAQPS